MIKYPDYDKLITSLLATDSIRFQKLLHMSQNALLTAVFCFFVVRLFMASINKLT